MIFFFHDDWEDIDYKASMERKHRRATSGISNAADQRFTDLLIKKGKGPLKMNSNSNWL
jgi:hypothetical protein